MSNVVGAKPVDAIVSIASSRRVPSASGAFETDAYTGKGAGAIRPSRVSRLPFSIFHFSFLLFHFSLLIPAGLLLQGCQSYTIVQRNVFADDDGNVVTVDYGRSESDHVNTFVAPGTGREMEFKSKLVVKARFAENVPDFLEVLKRGTVTNRIERSGESFKAWQCMNVLPKGTMYRSDDDEWMLLANGFSCTIYHQTEWNEKEYLEVFRGVLCEIDDSCRQKKDERWKKIPVKK